MSLSYSEIMSRTAYLQKLKWIPYTGYNAVLYARWLPYAILLPILAAIGMSLSLFLPWFSIGNTAFTAGNTPLRTYSGFQIATSGAALGNDIFIFPLWLLVLLGLALIVLSVLLFRGKILTPSLSGYISLTFGFTLLLEIIYFFTSSFGSFSLIRSHLHDNVSLAVYPSYGLWVCLLVTIISGGLCLLLFSNLSWYWRLAQEDVKQVMRKTNFRPIRSERAFYNGKEATQNIDIGYSGTQKS